MSSSIEKEQSNGEKPIVSEELRRQIMYTRNERERARRRSVTEAGKRDTREKEEYLIA